jgi:hypothetical protein
MEVTLKEDIQLTKHDTWTARIWQRLVDLDEAISTSPLENLEGRVAALEQKVWSSSDPLANRNQNPPITKQ